MEAISGFSYRFQRQEFHTGWRIGKNLADFCWNPRTELWQKPVGQHLGRQIYGCFESCPRKDRTGRRSLNRWIWQTFTGCFRLRVKDLRFWRQRTFAGRPTSRDYERFLQCLQGCWQRFEIRAVDRCYQVLASKRIQWFQPTRWHQHGRPLRGSLRHHGRGTVFCLWWANQGNGCKI